MNIFFICLCVLLAAIVLRGVIGGKSVLEFPVIASLLGLAWIVPQGVALENLPTQSYDTGAFWVYVTACFAFIALGFAFGRYMQTNTGAQTAVASTERFDMNRLTVAAGVLGGLGIAAYFLMGTVDTSSMRGQWTGVITLYALLNKACGFGLCLSVLIFARTKSRVALAIAVVCAVPIAVSALTAVRREAVFDLIVLTAGAWYLAKAKSPPRLFVLIGIVIGSLILNNPAQLRGYVNSNDRTLIDALADAEAYDEMSVIRVDEEEANEVRQAQSDFWYLNETGEWEFGADYWNKMVHQYVPAFLVGREFKDSLKFSTLAEQIRDGEVSGFEARGATRTGFSDTYRSFGPFGVLVFGLIGFLFGRLYGTASTGGIVGQYYYLVLMAEGMKSITHGTSMFFSAIPFLLVLSYFAFLYAKNPDRTRRASHLHNPAQTTSG